MKTYLTKLSSSLFLILICSPAFAKPVAQVIEVIGTVFVISPDGKTTSLKLNQHVEEKSEIMVDEGASITLNDYYDSTYHLLSGSHLKFFNKSVQLKRGKTWIRSKSSKHTLSLTTANGHVNFGNSEFISSFDQVTARSQFLVVTGDVEVSNILDKDMKYTVTAGTFTLVDPDIENGTPRAPTKVGLASLNNALSEFKRLPEEIKDHQYPARSIASVEKSEIRKGEIIFITSHRLPASVNNGAHKYFKKFKKIPKSHSEKENYTSAPINFYGLSPVLVEEDKTPRQPASIQVVPPAVKQINQLNMTNSPEFDESLKMQSVQQPKYTKELQNLINDLTSY